MKASILVFIVTMFFTSGALCQRMKFISGWSGGNCNDCEFTIADGTIEDNSVDDFRNAETAGSLIYLNSEGGSLLGAIALGNEFRKRGFRTIVGKTDIATKSDGPVQIISGGVCESACSYAFLGGTERLVPADTKFGIHSFSTEIGPGSQPTFTAADITNAQILTGVMLEYTQRMGVDPILVKLASEQPSDSLYFLSQSEIRSLHISWDPLLTDPLHLEIYRKGVVAVAQTADKTKTITVFCKDDKLHLMLTTPLSRSESDSRSIGSLWIAKKDFGDGILLNGVTRNDGINEYLTVPFDKVGLRVFEATGDTFFSFNGSRPVIEATLAVVPDVAIADTMRVVRKNCI